MLNYSLLLIWLRIAIALLMPEYVYASQEDFDLYRQYARSVHTKSVDAATEKLDEKTRDNIYGRNGLEKISGENIPESTYLNKSETDIVTDTKTKAVSNHQSKLLRKHFSASPLFLMRPDEPSLEYGANIMTHAKAIASGKSDDNVACRSEPKCEINYEKRQCQESALIGLHTCKKQLKVEVEQQTRIDQIIRVYVSGNSRRGTVVNFNLRHQNFTSDSHMKNLSVRIDPTLPTSLDDVPCDAIDVLYAGAANYEDPRLSGNNRTEHFTVRNVVTPNCTNNWQGRIEFYQHRHRSWYKHGEIFYYRIRSQPPPVIKREYWQNNCALFESGPLCRPKAPAQCTQGHETRIIDGVSLTRDCWEKKQTFICGRNPNPQNSNCVSLREQGCEQIASQCIEIDPQTKACARYQQTLRCSKLRCDDNKLTIKCDNKKPFCIDGDCVQTSRNNVAAPQFQKNVSMLSAILDGAKDYNGSRIFTGHDEYCEKAPLGAKNCCRDKGWLKKLGSACSASAKRLAELKSRGLCLYVGHACDKKLMGSCILQHKKYCCFDSKLGRLVQQQGKNQLNKNFGSGKHPDCSGFTAEEFQTLDFSAMNLSSYYDDLRRKMTMPDVIKSKKKIEERVQSLYLDGGDA